ncbi:hypothetical protein M2459_002379 [Parabacteroides sp. PF5-5]|uniref:ABC transporter permease n=1 Tax=unclassified Parabacteroides TaxID=2649774 RepID=UPI002474FDF4|nr:MULTISPECIES: ABC transporter permease [unclassified Parabacteroides]MDH6305279.1 hypothetical protein [Parabacteroides sp. PH5-39]MDH6316632.1 hypothetical protein [Parabacteroides sp. PF5-13]MDH6320188.1 hypothetical protein [Parabacteroides sp. PH5-13]MDH6323869.1 hypothetical protein [Parabacteroides sp. PH5-8]MDH6327865.1 hypothetical protein [Parabacteroides sp. PH5-41]
MIQHVFKLIKTQWKNNIWIILELFIVSALMWYIVDYFSVMLITSRIPLGFEIENTYAVKIAHYQSDNPNYIDYGEDSEEPALNFLRIVDRIRNHSEIMDVSIGQWHYPYCSSNMTAGYRHDSLRVNARILYVTPSYFEMFSVHPAAGGEPSLLGEALEHGVIISSGMEEALFPGSHAAGQTILTNDSTSSYRVSAVSVPLKNHRFSRRDNYIYFPFQEHTLMGMNEENIKDNTSITFRTRSGMNEKDFASSFKAEMNTQLSIGNFYITGIIPISELRTLTLKADGVYESVQNRTGFTVFFLLNVFLGVIGTFWLRIKKRREEIGLCIAVGSSRHQVMRQMMTESLGLLLIALVPAIIIWGNLILVETLPVHTLGLTWQRFALNSLFTILPLSLVIILATWYPAWRSASIQPAEALHYE